MNKSYEIISICNEPWAERISKYWQYLTGKRCCVLLGKTEDSIILLRRTVPETGLQIQGIVFESPINYPCFRNFIWHEAGHLLGGKSEDPVEHEFLADKWAMDTALARGFNKVAEEIILRCVSHCKKEVNPIYQKSSKKILLNYINFAESIVKKYRG